MKPNQIENRITAMIDAWSTLRPDKSFAGMTLEEFKAAVKPCLDARSAVTDVEQNYTDALVQRDNADTAIWPVLQRVVGGVVADKDEGNDGALYKAMGFVRQSERASGLTRNTNSNGAPQSNATLAKAA